MAPHARGGEGGRNCDRISHLRCLVHNRDRPAIPLDCFNLLAASAAEDGALYKENYFVFTDGMANGYYSDNAMTSFADLPPTNKFGFVTLSCRCRRTGGAADCCRGARARIALGTGLDDPATLGTDLRGYAADVCAVTRESIGDRRLPPSGERAAAAPTTPHPTLNLWAGSAPAARPAGGGAATGAPAAAPPPPRESSLTAPATAATPAPSPAEPAREEGGAGGAAAAEREEASRDDGAAGSGGGGGAPGTGGGGGGGGGDGTAAGGDGASAEEGGAAARDDGDAGSKGAGAAPGVPADADEAAAGGAAGGAAAKGEEASSEDGEEAARDDGEAGSGGAGAGAADGREVAAPRLSAGAATGLVLAGIGCLLAPLLLYAGHRHRHRQHGTDAGELPAPDEEKAGERGARTAGGAVPAPAPRPDGDDPLVAGPDATFDTAYETAASAGPSDGTAGSEASSVVEDHSFGHLVEV